MYLCSVSMLCLVTIMRCFYPCRVGVLQLLKENGQGYSKGSKACPRCNISVLRLLGSKINLTYVVGGLTWVSRISRPKLRLDQYLGLLYSIPKGSRGLLIQNICYREDREGVKLNGEGRAAIYRVTSGLGGKMGWLGKGSRWVWFDADK